MARDDYDDDQDLDDDRDSGPPDDQEMLDELRPILDEKFRVHLPDHVTPDTLIRDLLMACHGHPGWQEDGDQGQGDYDESSEDEDEDEDEDQLSEDERPSVHDLDDEDKEELVRQGRAREEMPVAQMSHAARSHELNRLGRPLQPRTVEEGKALADEQLRGSKFFAAKPREGTARLGHGRKSKRGDPVTPERGRAAAKEIAANCNFLRSQ